MDIVCAQVIEEWKCAWNALGDCLLNNRILKREVAAKNRQLVQVEIALLISSCLDQDRSIMGCLRNSSPCYYVTVLLCNALFSCVPLLVADDYTTHGCSYRRLLSSSFPEHPIQDLTASTLSTIRAYNLCSCGSFVLFSIRGWNGIYVFLPSYTCPTCMSSEQQRRCLNNAYTPHW